MTQVKLTDVDNGHTVEATKGSLIVVSLEENPTTGFRWAIDSLNPQIVALRQSKFIPDQNVAIGGSSVKEFIFETKQFGETTLVLKLWRDWEGENSTIQRYSVILKIR